MCNNNNNFFILLLILKMYLKKKNNIISSFLSNYFSFISEIIEKIDKNFKSFLNN